MKRTRGYPVSPADLDKMPFRFIVIADAESMGLRLDTARHPARPASRRLGSRETSGEPPADHTSIHPLALPSRPHETDPARSQTIESDAPHNLPTGFSTTQSQHVP